MENLIEFRYPKSLEETLSLLESGEGKAKIVAGSTSVGITRDSKTQILVDVSRIGLDTIEPDGDKIRIGGRVTAEALWESEPVLEAGLDALREAARTAGPSGVRAAMTIGGSVAQCYPWSDLPVAMLVEDTFARIASHGKPHREVAMSELMQRHPSKQLDHSEMIESFSFAPARPGYGSAFVKLSRTTCDYALVSVAASVVLEQGGRAGQGDSDDRVAKPASIKVVVGAARPLPVVVPGIDELVAEAGALDEGLLSAIAKKAASASSPIADMRASKEYRQKAIEAMVPKTIRRAVERAKARLAQG
jgi:carbon-monoxide dehydrogenase medium subunit